MSSPAIPHRKEDTIQFRVGEEVFKKGDPANCMYLILSGEVEIRLGDKVLEKVGHGSVFGEMGLIDHSPRAETAVAVSNGIMLRIEEKQFESLVKESPFFALKVLRTVVERIRRADALAGLDSGD
jgi:CRP-like cAMP-binding protein